MPDISLTRKKTDGDFLTDTAFLWEWSENRRQFWRARLKTNMLAFKDGRKFFNK